MGIYTIVFKNQCTFASRLIPPIQAIFPSTILESQYKLLAIKHKIIALRELLTGNYIRSKSDPGPLQNKFASKRGKDVFTQNLTVTVLMNMQLKSIRTITFIFIR